MCVIGVVLQMIVITWNIDETRQEKFACIRAGTCYKI